MALVVICALILVLGLLAWAALVGAFEGGKSALRQIVKRFTRGDL